MRKEEAVRTAHAMALIFVLLASEVSLFPFIVKAYDSEEGNIRVATSSRDLIQPIIRHPDMMDKDFNQIQDSMENMISQMVANKGAVLPVVVTLYSPVSNEDLERFVMLGGRVTRVYQYVTYGFAGVIPAANISNFAALEKRRLSIIEYDAPVRYHLDVSVPLIRARPTVWETYGYRGSPSESIAIIDTGIDDSHPDVGPYGDLNFSRKIVGWYDATADGASTPQDYGEHGTHVAGIAAGTGMTSGLQGSGNIQTTFTYILPSAGWGYIDYIDVMNPGVIELSCRWDGNNDVLLRLYDPAEEWVAQSSGRSQPLILTYNTTDTPYPTGRYGVLVGNLAGPSGSPFSCTENYPYQGLNDGYNLFTGVAPNSKLVGVKVFNNAGSGTTSTVMAGMDWVIQNRLEYHIIVASMSIGLENGGTDSTLDQKADTMVQNGIMTTVSAGNDYLNGYTIGSPGTAAYVITVAATNDQNGITSYSSNGDSLKNEFGLTKPDVAAPGGTFQPLYGNQILSTDSNDVDAGYSGYVDRNVNDYQQMAGTSMSAPHVAGLAALLIQALGDWNWTLEEALRVKMLLSMTAFETQNGEEGNLPTLNRGGKDNVEGYGRISADAAIEAATMTYDVGDLASDTFGPNPSDKKVWARQVSLQADTRYEFRLSVPSNADYDLYLYSGEPDGYGQPTILTKSVSALQGAEEIIEYTPDAADTYYIVAKWVNGNGMFNLQSTSTQEHDVAVLSVEPSTAEVYAGETVNITVVVKNEGNSVETFNVTAYYDDTVIGLQNVTDLEPGASTALMFSWNTTGATTYLNYTIRADASFVSGESDLSDNSLTDGTVLVKDLGDINGDGRVGLKDAVLLCQAYGKTPNPNPQADLNGDGHVDLQDAIILSNNWTGL